MTGFGDLNLKFPLTLAISVFMSGLNSKLSMKKVFITVGPRHKFKPAGTAAEESKILKNVRF